MQRLQAPWSMTTSSPLARATTSFTSLTASCARRRPWPCTVTLTSSDASGPLMRTTTCLNWWTFAAEGWCPISLWRYGLLATRRISYKSETERGPKRPCRSNTQGSYLALGIRMRGESYRRWLRSLLLYLCYVFRAQINSLACWLT